MIKKDTWNSVYNEYKWLSLPTPEWICMNWACSWSKASTSPRMQVGAVITSINCEEVFSYGFNGLQKDAIDVPTNMQPGQDGYLHAEENALLKLKTKEPAKMFITHMPCINCARKIINSKTIKEVYYLMSYRDASGVGELVKAGIKVYHFQITDYLGNAFNDSDAYEWLLPVGLSGGKNQHKYETHE
jgi:deoxycytidylate deaminase